MNAQIKLPALERTIEELEKNIKLAVYLLKTMLQLVHNLKQQGMEPINKQTLAAFLGVTCLACELPTSAEEVDLVRRQAQTLYTEIHA